MITLTGKISPASLEKYILGYGGAARPELLIGPAVGEDAAVIRWPDGKFLIFASDPIVGAAKGAGRLLVQVNANDIAVKGGKPAFIAVTLILPPSLGEPYAARIMQEIHDACCELDIAIAGGHTEFNALYEHPVLMGSIIGTADKVMSAADIKRGDKILVTKHAGIEGMSILAMDRPALLEKFLTEEQMSEAASWCALTSIVKEAQLLTELAVFMHDPTEGGFMGGLSELQYLAKLEFDIDKSAIPIHEITKICALHLNFDPLCLIASGSLIAVIPQEHIEEACNRLDGADIPWALVGSVTDTPYDKQEISTKEELWRLLEGK